jgi:hypothetical protein
MAANLLWISTALLALALVVHAKELFRPPQMGEGARIPPPLVIAFAITGLLGLILSAIP